MLFLLFSLVRTVFSLLQLLHGALSIAQRTKILYLVQESTFSIISFPSWRGSKVLLITFGGKKETYQLETFIPIRLMCC